jgi:hypothetical protein
MTLERTFRDRSGTLWRVIEVPPDDSAERKRERRQNLRKLARTRELGALFATRPHAWLRFESKSERRRLSSVPNQWSDLDDADLEDLMAAHSTLIYDRPLHDA